MKIIVLIAALLVSNVFYGQTNTDQIKNVQQRLATNAIDKIEQNKINDALLDFDENYLKNNKNKIISLLTKYYQETLVKNPKAKRAVTLVMPTGFNLFRFRYFDSTGEVLQLDLSFSDNNINSKIQLIEIKDKEAFEKQRAKSKTGVIFSGDQPKVIYPRNNIIILQNINFDNRTFAYNSQAKSILNWIWGRATLNQNKNILFSPEYNFDTVFYKQKIAEIKKRLPKNFFNFNSYGSTYNNIPNENAIWFLYVFSQINKDKSIKAYAAYKVYFTGNDASVDSQRANAKVTNVEFITDLEKLKQIELQLKNSKEAL
ncbi:MAG: hypothetical protein QM535_21910 [Limnohabitans sp.]|nr:hypothetical protein [Limnohabitans sp.]